MAASLAALLQARGYRVRIRKFDPYLNVDPGTMSPYQHGEVYVTDDGAETDLDLGHYERFTGVPSRQTDNVTIGPDLSGHHRQASGAAIISARPCRSSRTSPTRSRRSRWPRPTISISCCARSAARSATSKSLPFIEAIRQLGNDLGRGNAVIIHCTLVPYIAAAGELKTKPTQHASRELRGLGVQPDVLVCRCEQPLPDSDRAKIALFCNVPKEAVIPALDARASTPCRCNITREGLDDEVLDAFGISTRRAPDLARWTEIMDRLTIPRAR